MTKETVSQIKERIAERFDILDILTQECLNGNSRALIVSGPPGLGKSFTVERRLKESSNELFYSIVKGYVRPTGLFTMLYKHRNKGDVLVFDDADTTFDDREEPFIDVNESNSFDTGEGVIDVVNGNDTTGANGVHDIGDSLLNSPSCTHSSLCSPRTTTYIWTDIALEMDGPPTVP